MKAIFVAMFMTLLFGLRAHAATYWVSPNGQSLWKDCQAASPLNGIEACNLTVANANAVAGDTVFLREGIYNTYINPSNSGTSDTNRIVFTNFNGENVTIYNTSYGILLEDKSYVTVSGINCYYLEQFLVMKRSNHNIVSFCTFHLGRNLAQWTGSVINDNSQYNKVSNCIFWNFGKTGYESGDNDGAMLDIGTIESYSDNSFYNLIEGNHFYNCGHHCFAPWSKYTVFRNNYLHNEPWGPLNVGYRVSITHGRSTGWNLFERNRFAFADGSAVGLRSSNNIFRFNSFYNNSLGGLQIVGMQGYTLPNDNLVYHNVFYLNGYGADYEPFSGAVYFADWNNVGPLHGNVFKNNIFFANKGGAFTYDSDVPERTSIIENNYEGDPKFVSDMSHEYFPFGPQPDFSLQAESPCIDAGGTLTNIISSTGTGTKFKVANPWYFYDGWTIPGEQGDLIQLEGETTSVRIQKIDYTTKEITVESPISWTENQGISLAFSGAAPDIGAYEYTITSCQTKAECPDIICKNKNCIGHECVYSDADENTLCRGDCMVCSGGRCMKNYDLLCGIGEVCSDGLCIDNPNCISTEEINAAIISWYTSGNITMNSLIDEIIKWKNHCSD